VRSGCDRRAHIDGPDARKGSSTRHSCGDPGSRSGAGAQTFFMDENMAARQVDAVVTVADAKGCCSGQ